MRELWAGLCGQGDYRDLSWIAPTSVAFTALCIAVTALAAMP